MRLLLGSTKETGAVDDHKRISEPATREHLEELAMGRRPGQRDDLVLFGFIGEGRPARRPDVLLRQRFNLQDRAKTAVTALEIEHDFDKLKSLKFSPVPRRGLQRVRERQGSSGRQTAAPELSRDEAVSRIFRLQAGPGRRRARGTLERPNPLFVQHRSNAFFRPGEARFIYSSDCRRPEGGGGHRRLRGGRPCDMGRARRFLEKEVPNLAKKHGKTDGRRSKPPPRFSI